MCLIIHAPKGQSIPKWILESGQEYNSDGTGIMHAGTFEKWLYIKPEKLKEKIDKLIDNGDVAVHFRFATHGAVNQKNAHPFRLRDGSLLMHNGILSKYGRSTKTGASDTALFAESFLNPRIKGGETWESIIRDAEKESYGNRLAFMFRDGTIHRTGHWTQYEGLQFSNTSMWDYPHSKLYGRGPGYGTAWYTNGREGYGSTAYMYDDEKDQYDRFDELSLQQDIGADIREYLYLYADDITLDQGLVDGRDAAWFDYVLSGEVSVVDFLEECEPATAIALFADLCRREVIRP